MVCGEIQKTKLEFELKHGRKPKIALMGLAFKPNIDDLRESPANYSSKLFAKNNDETHFIVEPNLNHQFYV